MRGEAMAKRVRMDTLLQAGTRGGVFDRVEDALGAHRHVGRVSTACTGEEVGFGPETRPQPIFAKLFEQPWAKQRRDPHCPCLGGCESACGHCRHHSLSTAPVLRVVARSRTASAARRGAAGCRRTRSTAGPPPGSGRRATESVVWEGCLLNAPIPLQGLDEEEPESRKMSCDRVGV